MSETSNIDYEAATARQRGMLSGAQQLALREKHVAIAGAGGIGGIAALLCAKAGIGMISICDYDCFEVVNIVEQEFADYGTVGRKKVEVAAEQLRRHGHGIEVRVVDRKIERIEDALELMADADYAFSAVDNVRAKILVDRAADRLGIPLFLAANLGWIVFHLAYLPGERRYEHMYRGLAGLEELTDEAVRYMQFHHNVYFACAGGFPVECFRGLITGREDHLRYMAPQAYIAASLAVNDLIKYATGRGVVAKLPEFFAFDTLRNRVIDLESLEPQILEITRTAYAGKVDEACRLFVRYFPYDGGQAGVGSAAGR